MDENSNNNGTPKMIFNFGALKKIKSSLDLDLLGKDNEVRLEKLTWENYQTIAAIGIQFSKPGITEQEANELSEYVTLNDVLKTIRRDFGATEGTKEG